MADVYNDCRWRGVAYRYFCPRKTAGTRTGEKRTFRSESKLTTPSPSIIDSLIAAAMRNPERNRVIISLNCLIPSVSENRRLIKQIPDAFLAGSMFSRHRFCHV